MLFSNNFYIIQLTSKHVIGMVVFAVPAGHHLFRCEGTSITDVDISISIFKVLLWKTDLMEWHQLLPSFTLFKVQSHQHFITLSTMPLTVTSCKEKKSLCSSRPPFKKHHQPFRNTQLQWFLSNSFILLNVLVVICAWFIWIRIVGFSVCCVLFDWHLWLTVC